jgi:hypothetical protein
MARIRDFGRRIVDFFQIELGHLPHYLTKKKLRPARLGLTFTAMHCLFFFSYCKINNFREKPLIKLYKFRGHVHIFG